MQDINPEKIDIAKSIIGNRKNVSVSFASGDSMTDAGIDDGDLLILDGDRQPKNGDICVVAINGELTVKYIFNEGGRVTLHPANPKYSLINISEDDNAEVLGVVIKVIKEM